MGLELSGWAFGPSVGVLDELFGKVLVLESDGDKVVIVTTDLIGFRTKYADEIRVGIAEKLGTSSKNVLVSASHTHSGPATAFLRHWGEIDESYVRVVQKKIIGAAVVAANTMGEAKIGFGSGLAKGVGVNRRDPENGSLDPEVGVIRIDNGRGEMMAVLMNYSCHPVAAHNYENLISADYPGYAMRVIEKVKGERVIALHTTGASGDINPRQMHHIKYAEKFGNMVGAEALKVAENIDTQSDLILGAECEQVQIPVQKLPEMDELRDMTSDARKEFEELSKNDKASYNQLMNALIIMDWAEEALEIIESGQVLDHLGMEIQAIRLNDSVLLAVPGELFVDIGLNIKQASPYPYTFVVELANGAISYLPTRKAFEKGGYELDFASKVYGIYSLTPETQSVIEEGVAKVIGSL